MTKLQLLSKVMSAHWGLDKMRGRTVLSAIVQSLITGQRPDKDIFGDPLPCMQKVGDIALIPLTGVIYVDVPDWIKEYGLWLTDINDITQEIANALNDPVIQFLVFDVDSPGGLSSAGNRLFDVIDAASRKKPCFAYCGHSRDMASAAYDAIAACTRIACSPHAEGVGCVGSYLAYLDDTEFWLQMGFKWEVFKSGEYKGIGESVPLTEAQRKFLQDQTDYYGSIIRGNVSKYHPAIPTEDLQGQWYAGTQAAQKTFVHELKDDLQTAIVYFRNNPIR
ncbi:MAG TPA: S49 family peptidase [Chthoniobacterales bacterium]|jgi:ClpP class serine protease